MDNVLVEMVVTFTLRCGDEKAIIESNPAVGAVNPSEHASPDSFLGDCEHTVNRWMRDLAEQAPEMTKVTAAVLGALVTTALLKGADESEPASH